MASSRLVSIAWPPPHPAPGTRAPRPGHPIPHQNDYLQAITQPVVMRPFPAGQPGGGDQRPQRLLAHAACQGSRGGELGKRHGEAESSSKQRGEQRRRRTWDHSRCGHLLKARHWRPRTRRIQITRSSSPHQGNSEITVPPWSLKIGPARGRPKPWLLPEHGSASRDGLLCGGSTAREKWEGGGARSAAGHDTGSSISQC